MKASTTTAQPSPFTLPRAILRITEFLPKCFQAEHRMRKKAISCIPWRYVLDRTKHLFYSFYFLEKPTSLKIFLCPSKKSSCPNCQ